MKIESTNIISNGYEIITSEFYDVIVQAAINGPHRFTGKTYNYYYIEVPCFGAARAEIYDTQEGKKASLEYVPWIGY